MAKKKAAAGGKHGGFIVLNGEKIKLKEHATDFSVFAASKALADDDRAYQAVAPMSATRSRVRCSDSADRDAVMDSVREETVAHHIYVVDGTDEEVVIDDTIILTLRNEGTGDLEAIMEEFGLEYVRPMANAHVLRVTSATGQNPIKTANQIAERDEVESCSPDLMQQIR